MTSVTLPRSSSSVFTDRQQYRLLFLATFPMFLGAVLAVRLGRWAGIGSRPIGTPKSLLAEARATSSSALMFAFMG